MTPNSETHPAKEKVGDQDQPLNLLTDIPKCGLCEKSFRTSHFLRQHMTIAHSTFKCGTCCKTFYEKKNLQRHVALAHTNATVHNCPECEGSFKAKSYLKKHFNSVHSKPVLQTEVPLM